MSETKSFPQNEFYELCGSLEKFHEIFASLFKVSRPQFSDEVDTAAVYFDKIGNCINFLINQEFWESIDNYKKEFVICHEMCHVILSHGIRAQPFKNNYTPDIINIALDLAVNHLLISLLNFNRYMIDGWETLCFCDTVLKDKDLDPNKSFEYYISKIDPNLINIEVEITDHEYLQSFDASANDKVRRLSNEINKTLDKDQLEAIKKEQSKLISHGYSEDETGFLHTYTGCLGKVKKIKKWESVLTKYVAKAEKERETQQWVRLNRRLACLDSSLLLPSDMEILDRANYKYKIWLFLDYSGSCSNLQDTFFKASNTFDPKKFEVKKFAHDTRVKEFQGSTVDLWSGGTNFRCIEQYIQDRMVKDRTSYPDAIFCFTDGQASPFESQIPERWYVFLSQIDYYTKCYSKTFPPKTNIYNLFDFIREI